MLYYALKRKALSISTRTLRTMFSVRSVGESKSANGPGGSISASGFGLGGPNLGGPNPLGQRQGERVSQSLFDEKKDDALS